MHRLDHSRIKIVPQNIQDKYTSALQNTIPSRLLSHNNDNNINNSNPFEHPVMESKEPPRFRMAHLSSGRSNDFDTDVHSRMAHITSGRQSNNVQSWPRK
jgi:hypothetical protein